MILMKLLASNTFFKAEPADSPVVLVARCKEAVETHIQQFPAYVAKRNPNLVQGASDGILKVIQCLYVYIRSIPAGNLITCLDEVYDLSSRVITSWNELVATQMCDVSRSLHDAPFLIGSAPDDLVQDLKRIVWAYPMLSQGLVRTMVYNGMCFDTFLSVIRTLAPDVMLCPQISPNVKDQFRSIIQKSNLFSDGFREPIVL